MAHTECARVPLWLALGNGAFSTTRQTDSAKVVAAGWSSGFTPQHYLLSNASMQCNISLPFFIKEVCVGNKLPSVS